jgi:hypothetical protein
VVKTRQNQYFYWEEKWDVKDGGRKHCCRKGANLRWSLSQKKVGYVVSILKENNERASVVKLANAPVVYRRGPVNSIAAISDDVELLKL